jgi:hypothetical protein
MDDLFLFLSQSGFANITFGNILMIAIGIAFISLAIVKHYEPLLLLPIGFGVLAGNLAIVAGHEPQRLRRGQHPVVPVLRRVAGHLPAPDLPRHRRDDGLLDAAVEPEARAAGGRRADGHLHHAHRRALHRLHPRRGRRHRHHRRRRRPDGHLPVGQAGAAPAGSHRHLGLLVHGARPGHPATDHAAAHHEGGAAHPHEAAPQGVAAREDLLPHRHVPDLRASLRPARWCCSAC